MPVRSTLAALFVLALPAAAAAQDAAAGQRVFNQCRACHTVDQGGRNGVGPNLHGVIGRRAGSLPDYAYSDGMRRAGFVWSAQTLDTFLQSPTHMVPGTRMYNAFPSAERRALVIAYLQGQASE